MTRFGLGLRACYSQGTSYQLQPQASARQTEAIFSAVCGNQTKIILRDSSVISVLFWKSSDFSVAPWHTFAFRARFGAVMSGL